MKKGITKTRASREAKMEPVHIKEAADLKALYLKHIKHGLGWSQATFADRYDMGLPISSFSPRLAEENDAYELAATKAETPQATDIAPTPEE